MVENKRKNPSRENMSAQQRAMRKPVEFYKYTSDQKKGLERKE